jgi:hypothetical protein
MSTNTTQNNIEVFRGDSFGTQMEFTDDDGVAIDITGWTIFFTIKKKKSDTDDQAVISKTITTFDDPTSGIASVTLTSTETYNLDGTYFYDFQFKDNTGSVSTIVAGGITFLEDITRRTS